MPDPTEQTATIQALWEYSAPAESEARFRTALAEADAEEELDYRLQLLTQIARTHSLRREFYAAHTILDEVDAQLTERTPTARVRYLLELGRTYNSNGVANRAGPLFAEAWDVARAHSFDGLAVDAAHMSAIIESGDAALRWNRTALELAESSDDPDAQRWRASLHNNLGWTYHERMQYEDALAHFEQALIGQQEKGDAELVRVAQWCIGRCYRSLGRLDDAVAIQRELEHSAPGGTPDGFVCEELAECLHALGRNNEAKPYFKRACDLLSQDTWLVEAEPQRINRLCALGRADAK